MQLYRSPLGAALLAGVFCLSPQAADSPSQAPFPTPQEGMIIHGGTESADTLFELLGDFSVLSGENLMMDADTVELLKIRTSGLVRDVSVGPEELYSVVEGLLVRNRCVLLDVRRESPRVMKVVSLETQARSGVRGAARYVREAEVEAYAQHPALMITTTVHLENADVRTVGQSMRAVVVDSNVEMILAVSQSRQIVLTGTAGVVWDRVQMLRDIDADWIAREVESEG